MGVPKSFRTGRLEWELRTVELSATTCSWIPTLWVSLVSFAAITLLVSSQWVFIVVRVYFVIDSVRKLLDTPSYTHTYIGSGLLEHLLLAGGNTSHFEELFWGYLQLNDILIFTYQYCWTSDRGQSVVESSWRSYEDVSKSFRTESITKDTLTKINTRWEAT
jgi:hypothetical protein